MSVGRSLDTALRRVRLAEELGFESAYVTHIAGRDSLTVVAAYALSTSRIRVGTGVMPIYSRTPATTAQMAATVDEISNGRLNLGLGVSHRSTVEGWHGETMEKPVAEAREYVRIVRGILAGERYEAGPRWRTSFRLAGLEPRPGIPILLAGLSPAMLRAAGEVADGVVLWLCNPTYIAEVVVPAVAEGRERAGKSLAGFDIVAAVLAAAVEDPGVAFANVRRELLMYFRLPFYRAAIARAGFDADIAAYDAAGTDTEAQQRAISDEFLEQLCAIGDVRAGVERYRAAGVTSPCLSPIPKADFEATLRAAAPTASAAMMRPVPQTPHPKGDEHGV